MNFIGRNFPIGSDVSSVAVDFYFSISSHKSAACAINLEFFICRSKAACCRNIAFTGNPKISVSGLNTAIFTIDEELTVSGLQIALCTNIASITVDLELAISSIDAACTIYLEVTFSSRNHAIFQGDTMNCVIRIFIPFHHIGSPICQLLYVDSIGRICTSCDISNPAFQPIIPYGNDFIVRGLTPLA